MKTTNPRPLAIALARPRPLAAPRPSRALPRPLAAPRPSRASAILPTLALALSAALLAFAAPAAERKLYLSEFRDRMAGAWVGQSVGVAYGAPSEFKRKGQLVPDAFVPAWTPDRVNNTFQQDDLYVEMSFLETLERRGVDVGPREAGLDFANSRYRLWCANANARDNLRRGIAAPDSSHPSNHPTTDDIDYQIEADFSGILSPGLPSRVLRFGQVFGRIMNYGDGLYAGDFIGGMYAAAYFESDRVKTVEAGLACIPADSGYAEMVRDMLAWYRADPKDWRAAWKKAVAKYGVANGPKLGKVSFFAIDVKINGAMVLLGYLFGDGDVLKTMDIATRGGFDSDCNPSSALGVLGVQIGLKGFAPEYVSQLDRHATWEFTSYTWDRLLAVCEKLTREIVVREGGRIATDAHGEHFLIPDKPAAPGPALSSSRPGPGGDARLTAAENAQILYAPCTSQGAQSQPKFLPALSAAPWIGDGRPERNGADWYEEDPAPEFAADFVLPEGVTETDVHFACAGFGMFKIGGTYPAKSDLDPLWSVYDKTVYAQTVRVTSDANGPNRLVPGTNTVTVRLGNGFYNLPPLRFWSSQCFREKLAHGRPCFKLTIDGVKDPLVWKWRKTNVIRNSVYLGTEVDATRPEDTNWQPAAVVKGPKGRIVPSPLADLGCADRDTGTSRWLKEGAVQVVDFGVNASGVPEFRFGDETRGTRIEIVYGERLNADGTVNVLTQTAGQIKHGDGGPGAPAIAAQRDVFVPGDGGAAFMPRFTWHVFRYAEIRGATSLVRHAARFRHSMVSPNHGLAPAAKAFRTNDPDLARLHKVCQRTFQANLIGGVQSDCPGRERLGYGGDIVATCEAMCLNFTAMKEVYLKVLQDFADEAAEDGWLTETAPYVGIADRGFGGRSGPISWTVAVPVLMDTLLRHYPDAADRILAHYPVCTRYIGLVEAKCPDGLVPDCIGDHEALERAPNGVTATAHWHEFVRLTATFARRLGKTEDAQRLDRLAERIATAFRKKYVKDGIVANGTQSAQAIGLYLGLVPPAEVPAAEARLVKAVEEKDCAPTTGIFATRYLLLYLSEHGRPDLARRLVLHRPYPGWLHMLDQGATTLWETWKESDNIYSNCHPMFGSADEWILRYGK